MSHEHQHHVHDEAFIRSMAGAKQYDSNAPACTNFDGRGNVLIDDFHTWNYMRPPYHNPLNNCSTPYSDPRMDSDHVAVGSTGVSGHT